MTGLVEQEPYLKIKKLFDEKKFDDIIDYCQKLLVKDPKNKLALQNISTAYNMVSGYQDAIQNADKILENDKTDEFALKNKMFAYEKLDRPDVNFLLISGIVISSYNVLLWNASILISRDSQKAVELISKIHSIVSSNVSLSRSCILIPSCLIVAGWEISVAKTSTVAVG